MSLRTAQNNDDNSWKLKSQKQIDQSAQSAGRHQRVCGDNAETDLVSLVAGHLVNGAGQRPRTEQY
jgi:hypothetical protein